MAFTVDKAFDLVESAHGRERLAHAFLITGPKGSGKSALAARMAVLLNGGAEDDNDLWGEPVAQKDPTLEEVEGEFVRLIQPRSKSRRITVDEMRSVEKMMNQSAPGGKWKIGVIVDADRMNESAENAFLKTLEEPPPQSLLLLLSGEPERLLPTVWSRCVHIPLQRLEDAPRSEVVEQFLVVLDSATREGLGLLETGLQVKAGLESLLKKRKEAIIKRYEAALKEEKAKYKNAIEGDWLEKREKTYEAYISAEYLTERKEVIDTLLTWMGDLIRQKTSGPGLALPDFSATTAAAVADESLDSLLVRVTAVEELRGLLETNVTEALALEVSLMKAFGPTLAAKL
ncbi:MAG: hypothetical protein ACON5H_01445 [Akkermansiaceae bacterium]